jgi:membrane protease YdiL (CAAX protease family)
MQSASFVTAFEILFALWLVLGAYVYVSLIRQIAARRRLAAAASDVATPVEPPAFGVPEAVVAALLIFWFFLVTIAAISNPGVELSDRGIINSLIATLGIAVFIAALLQLRGRRIEKLAGFSRMGAVRALGTGAILLFCAYPLVSIADVIGQRLLHTGTSKQSIVELFNTSASIQQRIILIVFAVAIAPPVEEFIFRFFIFGVLKRYFGLLFGVVANALLFAAVHGHLPSLAALFVLATCFTLAYEWSGSLLVCMSMHSIFNALTFVVLAFPDTFQQ